MNLKGFGEIKGSYIQGQGELYGQRCRKQKQCVHRAVTRQEVPGRKM